MMAIFWKGIRRATDTHQKLREVHYTADFGDYYKQYSRSEAHAGSILFLSLWFSYTVIRGANYFSSGTDVNIGGL